MMQSSAFIAPWKTTGAGALVALGFLLHRAEPEATAANDQGVAGTHGAQQNLEFHVRAVPERPLPCEPVALYFTVTNVSTKPVIVVNDFRFNGPGVDVLVHEPDDRVFKAASEPGTRHGGFRPITLLSGQSIRHKKWLINGGESASPAFALRDAGKYRVEVRYRPSPRGEPAFMAVYFNLDVRQKGQGEGLQVIRSPLPGMPLVKDPAVFLMQWMPARGLSPFGPLALAGGAVERSRQERLVGSYAPLLRLFDEILERYPDSPYAWYVGLAVARWEAHQGDIQRAAEIIESIEDKPLSSALREEMLPLQAEVYFALDERQKAEERLKKLEAMDPPEPLASEIVRIRRTWRTVSELVAALEHGSWTERQEEANLILKFRSPLALEIFSRAAESDDRLARLLAAGMLVEHYHDADASAYLWREFQEPPEDPRAFSRLIFLLSAEKRQEFEPKLEALLADPRPGVRLTAAMSLFYQYNNRSGVPVLIDLLDSRENLEGNGNPLGLLRSMTGQTFGRDPAAWRRWWEEEQKKQP